MPHPIKADWNDLVFTGRDRSYGAFLLRQLYPRHLLFATATAGLMLLLLVFGPLWARKLEGPAVVVAAPKPRIMEIPKLPPPIAEPEAPLPPPPPPPPAPEPIASTAFQIPEPTPEDQLTEADTSSIHSMEELALATTISLTDVEGREDLIWFPPGEGTGDIAIPQVIENPMPGPEEFVSVEEEPQPLNLKEVSRAIGYPQMARDAGIHGQVVVRVLVDRKGNYHEHKVIKAIHPLLSQAVEAQLAKLQFTPAIQGGKPIPFWVNIPFNFTLLE